MPPTESLSYTTCEHGTYSDVCLLCDEAARVAVAAERILSPDADPISLRLDAIDERIGVMMDGLNAMIEMLDGFAERAEPLLNEVERKVARRGKLFGGGNV